MVQQKLRLNVVAVDSKKNELGRALHVVSTKTPLPELQRKIEKALLKDGSLTQGNARLRNQDDAVLPTDELTGTVLRDGETVYAVCGEAQPQRGAAPPAPSRARPAPDAGAATSEQRLMNPRFARGGVELKASDKETFEVSSDDERSDDDERDDDDDEDVGAGLNVPGPREQMEEYPGVTVSRKKPPVAPAAGTSMSRAYAHANEAAHQVVGRADWLVENLTPRLREFIWARFQEAGLERASQKIAKHDDRHITILMKPHPRIGAEQPVAPVQYSIARVDIAEFERLAGRQVHQSRIQMEHLSKTIKGLEGQLRKGHAPSERLETVLPFKWKNADDHHELLQEAVGQNFNSCETFRPVFVIDTANLHGDYLTYVQAAMKRLLYGFVSGKSLFNFVHFPPEGRGLARTWASAMVPPCASALREAEEFLETLAHAKRVNLLDGIKCALQFECDSIYLLSSGFDPRYDPNFLLQAVRSLNLREVQITVIGIDVPSEQDEIFLRRLAETNHGDYKSKALQQQNAANMAGGQRRAPTKQIAGTTNRGEKMTIGGQMKISEVIYEEHKRHESMWLEEQKCANRLLLASAAQGAIPAVGDERQVRQKLLQNKNRLGGGYVYLEENMKQTPLREAYDAAFRGRDEPALWSGDAPERRGLARKSLPASTAMYNVLPGQRPTPPTTVTSLKADVSPGLPPPSMRTPGFGANPWERTEGALVRPSEEQARLIRQQQAADTPGSSQRAASARPGAPPRRSEDARARTERSIAERRAEAAKQVPDRPARPVEHEVPEAYNLERRWSWG